MGKDELQTLWWIVVYLGALSSGIVILRTLFVPPRAGGTLDSPKAEKSPFQIWIEFSRERAHQELEADLEKYRIDRGLIHRTSDLLSRDTTP